MNATVVAETVRRNATSIGWLSYVALVVICALGSASMNHPGALWPPLVGLLAVILGAAPIGPEFSSGTLQLILVKPVRRSVYLVSRVAGALLSVWIVAAFGFAAELAGRLLWRQETAWRALSAVLVSSVVQSILIAALLVLFGSMLRAYYNVALYFLLQIAIGAAIAVLAIIRASRNAFGNLLEANPWIERGVMAVERNLFPDRPLAFDAGWTMRTLAIAAAALALACAAFSRREVPYGAD